MKTSNKSKPTLKSLLNTIIQGDCIEVLKDFPDASVDLIFADPPYNLQLKNSLYRPNQTRVDAVDDSWDKFASFKAYDDFTRKWLAQCRRVLKKDGSIWVIGSYHNIYRLGYILQSLDYWILNDIVWIKTNPMPNFKGTRFNNAHETLIWAAKSQASKYTFHYKSMKAFNDDLQMRSDWIIPLCNGNERIKTNGQKAHSTQKPEELLYRIILSTSNLDDIVLDPFMGSGTTGAMAKKLQRKFIGIEQEPAYIEVANKRINEVVPAPREGLNHKIEIKPPKVPFGNLIEKNMVIVGEFLYSKDKIKKARVMADATLEYKDQVGSIHKISAYILNRNANNGWDYWYVQRDNKMISIDYLRKEYIDRFIKKINVASTKN